MLGSHASAAADRAPIPASVGVRPHDDKGTVMLSLIENAIERLEEAVEQETAALRTRAGVDLREFNDRKSQGLLELTRAMRHIDGTAPEPALLKRLTGLRAKLEVNSAALKLHLDAVREISAAMTDAMRDAESDGTYSQTIRLGSKAS
jgi:hypothetical protein